MNITYPIVEVIVCLAHGRHWFEQSVVIDGAIQPGKISGGAYCCCDGARLISRYALDSAPLDPDPLTAVAQATAVWRSATSERDALIQRAIVEGETERAIGRAAGVSGSAVHQRKAAALGDEERPHRGD